MNQQEALADEIDREIVADAKRKNPGVNPRSVTLTYRERIIVAALERRVGERLRVAQSFDAEVRRLQKIVRKDEA